MVDQGNELTLIVKVFCYGNIVKVGLRYTQPLTRHGHNAVARILKTIVHSCLCHTSPRSGAFACIKALGVLNIEK